MVGVVVVGVVVVELGWVVITEMGVLCSQLPTAAVVGNMRDRGSRLPLKVPPLRTLRNPNSTRPSASLRATMRTTTSCAERLDVAATPTVNGELRNQRPTATSAGKKRDDGSRRGQRRQRRHDRQPDNPPPG